MESPRKASKSKKEISFPSNSKTLRDVSPNLFHLWCQKRPIKFSEDYQNLPKIASHRLSSLTSKHLKKLRSKEIALFSMLHETNTIIFVHDFSLALIEYDRGLKTFCEIQQEISAQRGQWSYTMHRKQCTVTQCYRVDEINNGSLTKIKEILGKNVKKHLALNCWFLSKTWAETASLYLFIFSVILAGQDILTEHHIINACRLTNNALSFQKKCIKSNSNSINKSCIWKYSQTSSGSDKKEKCTNRYLGYGIKPHENKDNKNNKSKTAC